MSKARVDQAVILATGLSGRGAPGAEPRPLISVGGLPLLKRAILTAKRAGVRRFVVVLGAQAGRVREALAHDEALDGLEIRWVSGPQPASSDGACALQAAPHVDGEFFLVMADRVVDPAIYEGLQGRPAGGGVLLAVDRALNVTFGVDGGVKVKATRDERVARISPRLSDFDAVSAGVLLGSTALFDALRGLVAARGDASLCDGIQALAARGEARVWDIGAAWWQSVDGEATRERAEEVLFRSLTKAVDGPISRNVNRRFSKRVTRLVMNYNVVPNHMTTAALVIGLLSALITAMVTPDALWRFAVGGLLYQLSSMIDGCDGEIARLKLAHSDWGEWYDTVSDNIVNLSYQLAIGYALFKLTGAEVWLHIGVATVGISVVLCFFLYRRLVAIGRGTHLALEFTTKGADDVGPLQRLIAKLEFIGHRDFYALALMVLAFIGVPALKVALVLSLGVVMITASQWILMNLREAQARRVEAPQRVGA